MDKLSFNAEMSNKDKRIQVQLELYKFIEGNMYIIYCPSLDLSSYGYTEEKAKESFSETFKIYINYGINKNTLAEDMRKYGWNVKSMRQRRIKAPSTRELLGSNETLQDIVFNKNYEKISQSVEIPQFA